MIALFIHQNFPAQYKHLVRHYVEVHRARVIFITQNPNREIPGVEMVVYDPQISREITCHPYAVDFDHSIRAGLAVADACRRLAAQGVRPDIIFGHNGWGETLFVKDVFRDTPLLSYFEFYYHSDNVDVGFDPEYPVDVDPYRLRTRNAVNLLGFDAADWGNTPTQWQRRVYPPELRPRLTVLHEGVDTEVAKPDPDAWLYLDQEGVLLSRAGEIITYVARNLEPYRGFHIFMRAAAEIMRRRPSARIVVVGGDEISYGAAPPSGGTFREIMLRELGSSLDPTRLHFLGKISYDNYIRLLQISSAHVYLTYPFVLSWSFLEAMACGCAIVGSDTPPVLEVLRDGDNGLVADFFSPGAIADQVDAIIDHPDRADHLRRRARQTILEGYDLKTRQLPLWDKLVADLLAGRRPEVA